MENLQSNFRYERKYLLDNSSLNEFIKSLYLNNFHELYNPRFINNIYLDDGTQSSFQENIEGDSERKKYRVRWYGDKYGPSKKKFEIKIKSEQVNRKETFDLGEIQFNDPLPHNRKTILNKINEIVKGHTYHNKYLTAVLYNNYQRMYFWNPIDEIRITIDQDLNSTSLINSFSYSHKDIIVEIKYHKDNLYTINDKLNLFLDKKSKYIDGITKTNSIKHG